MKTEHQHSAGGVVVRDGEILLIALAEGRRWQLPKGHIEAGESSAEAAAREVHEETGVRGRPVGELPSIDYWFVEDGKRIHKRVDFFLCEYLEGSTRDFDPQEVSGAAWFPWEQGVRLLTFDNERRVARRALDDWRGRDGTAGKEEP